MSLLDGKEGGGFVIRGSIWRWCLGIAIGRAGVGMYAAAACVQWKQDSRAYTTASGLAKGKDGERASRQKATRTELGRRRIA